MMPEMKTLTFGGTTFEVADGAVREAIENLKSGNVAYYPDLPTAISDINSGVTDNALPGEDGACIKVFTAENGRLTVFLLDDVTVDSTITVNKDIDLVLAGHKINFVTLEAYLTFSEGTSCTINGEMVGSGIVKEGLNSSDTTRVCFIDAGGNKLTVVGGEHSLSGSMNGITHLIRTPATSKVVELFNCSMTVNNASATNTKASYCVTAQGQGQELVMRNVECSCYSAHGKAIAAYTHNDGSTGKSVISSLFEDCHFSAKSDWAGAEAVKLLNDGVIRNCRIEAALSEAGDGSKSTEVYGINNAGAVVVVEDSYVHTDAPGSDSTEEASCGIRNAHAAYSKYGTFCYATLYLRNTEVYGTHSGITNTGSLYVSGGILSGWSHGGLYTTHDTNLQATVVLKDVQLWSGFYNGFCQMEYITLGDLQSNCYIGDKTDRAAYGGDVYMDGCTFDSAGNGAFCVRGTNADHPNRLFISNSTLKGSTSVRVQSAGGAFGGTLSGELKIGVGCNFTPANISTADGSPDNAEETNALYRKHYPGEELTAEDYNALVEFMSGAGVS